MKFKIGDKVRKRGPCTRFGPLGITEDTVTGLNYNHSHVYLKESFWQRTEELELVEEKEMTHKYEEGKWYMWGGGECPLHPEDKVEVKVFNTSTGITESYPVSTVPKTWSHKYSSRVFAFKITKKYVPPVTKEMTIEEISKALGYDVKIVKG